MTAPPETAPPETEWRFTIAMDDTKAKHGERRWMTYAQAPSPAAAAHAGAGDRLLDIDAGAARGRTRCVFTIDADYQHGGQRYTVRFADPPFVAGSPGGPDVSAIIKEIARAPDGRTASFAFDTADIERWQVAADMKAIGSPIVRVPFAFAFDDERLPFPGWMMPDPDDPLLRGQDSAGPELWHGGPHPPGVSFLVIPTGA